MLQLYNQVLIENGRPTVKALSPPDQFYTRENYLMIFHDAKKRAVLESQYAEYRRDWTSLDELYSNPLRRNEAQLVDHFATFQERLEMNNTDTPTPMTPQQQQGMDRITAMRRASMALSLAAEDVMTETLSPVDSLPLSNSRLSIMSNPSRPNSSFFPNERPKNLDVEKETGSRPKWFCC
ncbi:MAG: hypothetical protein ACRCXC_08155 [Legionella sp.]